MTVRWTSSASRLRLMARIFLPCRRFKVRAQNDPHRSRSLFLLAIDLVHQAEERLHRLGVAQNGAVDKLSDESLAFRDLTAPAVLGDRELLVEDLGQDCAKFLAALRARAGSPTGLS